MDHVPSASCDITRKIEGLFYGLSMAQKNGDGTGYHFSIDSKIIPISWVTFGTGAVSVTEKHGRASLTKRKR